MPTRLVSDLVEGVGTVMATGTNLAPDIGKVASGALTSRLHAEQRDEIRADRRRSNITDALAARRFRIVVQPIVSLTDDEPHAVEALTRFAANPVRSPDLWFKEAEEVGIRVQLRSEEGRVGKEWVSTCRSRWSPNH